jgi:hypothetical protein
MDTTKKTCANCGNLFHGDYCNACGQKMIGRFTGAYIWQTLREDIIGLESGLLHTFKELWLRPGLMITSYINGATKQYYSPLKYLILWTAAYLLVLAVLNQPDLNPNLLQELLSHSNQVFSLESFSDFVVFLEWFMKQNTNFYLLGIIPFLAMSGLIFFQKKNFNLTELIIFYTYFCGQFAFCAVISSLVSIIPNFNKPVFSTALIFIFYFFLFFRMQKQFTKESWIISIPKGIGVFSLGTTMYWLFVFLVFNLLKYTFRS